MTAQDFVDDLDAVTDMLLDDGIRTHLGASQIGGKCARQVWLQFRCAGDEVPGGRMRRLWQRGHEEEFRFVKWLRAMGVQVRDYSQRLMYHDASDTYLCMDWDAGPSYHGGEVDDQIWMEFDDVSESAFHIQRATARNEGPAQWHFSEDFGVEITSVDPRTGEESTSRAHFSGSSDGKVGQELARWFPEIIGLGWGLLECKTHNDKSFSELKRKGVQQSKPGHYVQMQVYMHKMGLKWAIYLAVNKNTDEIYPEIVFAREEVARPYIDRGRKIVELKRAPEPLTHDPSWFECRFCHFKEQCHYGAELELKNCRSCAHSIAATGGRWYCEKHSSTIPENFVMSGCGTWEPCL